MFEAHKYECNYFNKYDIPMGKSYVSGTYSFRSSSVSRFPKDISRPQASKPLSSAEPENVRLNKYAWNKLKALYITLNIPGIKLSKRHPITPPSNIDVDNNTPKTASNISIPV